MWRAAAVVLLAAAGCRPLNEQSAPAPAGALECAVREAEERGYTRMAGESGGGGVRLSQRLPPPAADAPPPIDPDRSRSAILARELERQLLVRYRDGVLRIESIEPSEPGSRAETPGFASDHAAEILVLCGA